MDQRKKVAETGTVVGCHKDRRGALVSVAITLPLATWAELTANYAKRWSTVEDDLDVRGLKLFELIALFVSGEVDRWCSERADDAPRGPAAG